MQDLFFQLCKYQSNWKMERFSRAPCPRPSQLSCDVWSVPCSIIAESSTHKLIQARTIFADLHVLKPHAQLAQIGACIWCFPQKCQKQKSAVLKQFIKLATALPEHSRFVLSGLQFRQILWWSWQWWEISETVVLGQPWKPKEQKTAGSWVGAQQPWGIPPEFAS